MKNVTFEQALAESRAVREVREAKVKEMIANGSACITSILTPEGYTVQVFDQTVATVQDQDTVEMLHTVIRNSLIAAGVICDM